MTIEISFTEQDLLTITAGPAHSAGQRYGGLRSIPTRLSCKTNSHGEYWKPCEISGTGFALPRPHCF
jgi:hypothetical protein